MKRILMANDLSARSDRALRLAVSIANESGAEFEVITVIEESFLETTTRENETFAKAALTEQLKAVPGVNGIRISQRVIVGLDYEDIIQEADTFNADLVVLGVHRYKTREMFRGTTAERVVRHGVHPVLVVKDPVTGPYRRVVVVATDLSSHAEAAARTAAQLAPQGEIILLHAVHQPYIAFLGPARPQCSVERERKTGLGSTSRVHQSDEDGVWGQRAEFRDQLAQRRTS